MISRPLYFFIGVQRTFCFLHCKIDSMAIRQHDFILQKGYLIKMAQNYYQKEIETMSAEEMKKLQSEKLVKQVKHVYENVPYYKNLMDEKGVTPDDIHGIEDLHKLPFLTKADLRDAYPYGLLAKPLEDCVRIQSTSGTTAFSIEFLQMDSQYLIHVCLEINYMILVLYRFCLVGHC